MMLKYKVLACFIFLVCVTNSEDGTATYESYEGSRYNGTTEAPVISATNFSYVYAKNVLNISFVPTCIGCDYMIELIPETKFLHDSKRTLHYVMPVVNVTFKKNDIVAYGNYTVVIRVSDYYNDRIPFKSDLLSLRAYKTPFLDCNLWNVGIRLQDDIREHSITTIFELPPEFSSCFQTFTVELGIFPENDHKRKICWKNSTIYQRKNVTYNYPVMNVTFEDLPAKHYCVNITPRHEDCPVSAKCFSRYSSDGIELKEFKEDKLPSLKKENSVVNVVAIIVSLCAVIIIFIIGLIGTRKKLFGKYNPAYQVSTINSSNSTVPSVDSLNCKKELIVPILYAQDIDKQQEVAVALHSFLKECCHVTSIIGENNPEVFKNNSAWIQNNFDYRLSGNGNTKYKILILETDAAVRLHQHWRNPKKLVLKYRQYSHLNDVFLRGLTQLTSSPEFLEPNHDRVVVIHFSYFPDSNEIDCFKQKRLYLPHHMVELYNSLWDKTGLLNEKENLLNEWKCKDSYKELLRTIEEMKKFVTNNPDYLDKYVFGDTEVV